MNFKENFNFYSNIGIIFFLFFATLIYADTNGIWHDAQDVRGGTFGLDEQEVSSFYTFVNPVNINNNLKIGDNTTNYNVTINDREIQYKINQNCPDGQAIRQINEDGTVTCQDAGGLDNIYTVGYENYGEDTYTNVVNIGFNYLNTYDSCVGISFAAADAAWRSGNQGPFNTYIAKYSCPPNVIRTCTDYYRDGTFYRRTVTCKRVSVVGLIEEP